MTAGRSSNQADQPGDGVHPLRRKLSRFKSQLPYLPWALSLVWRAAPRVTTAWIALLVVGGALPAVTLYVTRAFIDQLTAVGSVAGSGGVFAPDWASLRPVVVLGLVLGGLLVGAELLRGVTALVRTAQAERVKDHLSALIQEQSLAIDLAFYDQADFFDHLHRARSDAGYRPLRLLESLGATLQGGTTLLAMLAVLAPYGLWLPLALLLSSLPAFWVVLSHAVRQHDWTMRVTPDERRSWYYDWLLTARDTAAEMRAFALGAHFRAAFDALRGRLRRERLTLARRQGLAGLAASATTLAVAGAAAAWMIWRYLHGELTLGDLALVVGAFQQGQRLARTLLESIGQILGDSLFIGHLHEFLALTPTVVSAPPAAAARPTAVEPGASFSGGADPLDALGRRRPRPPAIRCRDLTFRYPSSDRTVLDRLSLDIESGQVVALVGSNGAGKTSLLKLLCRFYDPQAGSIEIDGVDLRSMDVADLRRRIALLFQTPIAYYATALENVAMGDLERATREDVEAAARQAGADEVVARLSQGLDTQLGVWLSAGVDLSVGEWQRLGIARTYVRDASLLILDEPTSAMDPWAETEWLLRLREVARGRTVVIVTHRVSTARHADVIHVMENGRVVESGAHLDLVSQSGRYAALWSDRVRIAS
jgi:ATP-binding cassette, subfamily B, bacterial